MSDYLRKLRSVFWVDFRKATVEHVISALIVFAILIFQIRYGLIESGKMRANFRAIAGPYLLLGALLILIHAIRAPWKVHQEEARINSEIKLELIKTKEKLEKALAEPTGPELMIEFQQSLSVDPGALLIRNLRGGVAYDVTVHRANHQGLELVERDFTYIPEGNCVAWEPTIYCPKFPEERFTFRSFLTPRPRSEEDKSKGRIPVRVTYRDANKREFTGSFEIVVDYVTWKLDARLLSRELKV